MFHRASQRSFLCAYRRERLSAPGARAQPVTVCSKVAVLGAAGGIGQPLSLLLKMNNMVTNLALYDIANVAGVVADISHCNTPVKVKLLLFAFFGITVIEKPFS